MEEPVSGQTQGSKAIHTYAIKDPPSRCLEFLGSCEDYKVAKKLSLCQHDELTTLIGQSQISQLMNLAS